MCLAHPGDQRKKHIKNKLLLLNKPSDIKTSGYHAYTLVFFYHRCVFKQFIWITAMFISLNLNNKPNKTSTNKSIFLMCNSAPNDGTSNLVKIKNRDKWLLLKNANSHPHSPSPSPHSSYAAPARSARLPLQLYQNSTAAPGTWHPEATAFSQSRSRAQSTAGPAGHGRL